MACIKPGGVKLRFSTITTFYFGRQQGWIGVPREGGNTLGMEYYHSSQETGRVPDFEEEEVKTEFEMEEKAPPVSIPPILQDPEHTEFDRPSKVAKLCEEQPTWTSTMKEPGKLKLKLTTNSKKQLTKLKNRQLSSSKVSKPGEQLFTAYEQPAGAQNQEFSGNSNQLSHAHYQLSDTNGQVLASTSQSSDRLADSGNLSSNPSNLSNNSNSLLSHPTNQLSNSDSRLFAGSSQILQWSLCGTESTTRQRKVRKTEPGTLGGGVERKGECGTRGLLPISSRSRKSLLKNCGVRDLDAVEAMETKYLRQSRKQCGCSCLTGCHPGACECLDAGIQCQEERSGFPCACSTASCSNPEGRKLFDPTEVKMHFLQTMLEVQGSLVIE